MDVNLDKLERVNPLLAKLVDGNDLTADETEKLAHTIFLYDTEGYHLATFIGAVHAKGETSDELLGFYNAVGSLAEKLDTNLDPNKVIDLSGTGGGSFKSFNVSTTASFIVAAAGYTVAKEAYYSVTSPTGSADVFAHFGVDIAKLSKKQIEQTLEDVGICPIFVAYFSPKLANRAKISGRIFRERQIRVRSPFHLVSNVYSPQKMSYRIYGCYSGKYLKVLAELFVKLGFKRSLVMYADIGMPEISNVGKTTIIEQNGNTLKTYEVTANELGVAEARAEDIQTKGKEANIEDFVDILKGKGKPAKSDLVALNAGAALYVLGDTQSIEVGVRKAKEIINSGEGYRKLEALIKSVG